MSTGSEFSSERSPSRVAFLEESRVRVLFVADRADVSGEIRECLAKFSYCDFDVVLESDLTRAAARIRGPVFDLLLVDGALAGVRRSALVDLASELATRLPVVVLSGTESLDSAGSATPVAGAERLALRAPLDAADLPSLLVRTLQRARRLGAVALPPVFFRLERSAA